MREMDPKGEERKKEDEESLKKNSSIVNRS